MESNCRIDPARSRIYGVQMEIVRNAKTRMLHAARSKGRIWLLALLNCRKLNSFLVEKVASSLDVWFVLSFCLDHPEVGRRRSWMPVANRH